MGMIIIIGGIVLLLQLLWSVFCAKASAPAKIRLLNFAWFFCWLPCQGLRDILSIPGLGFFLMHRNPRHKQ